MAEDDDEIEFCALYENGHWVWDESTETLVFISDLPPKVIEALQITTKAPTGTIEFRDDVDVLEQIRFRRRYRRQLKPGQADVVTVQDIKDVALYTAPLSILSPMLINMLHLPTTDRFIRALIFYCQYYLQISEEMSNRILNEETKIRTPECEVQEANFHDDLCDLRVLVAKEYGIMVIGGADTKRFHHMGPSKKRRSLSDKDARLFETLLRICVQIVWLALGRTSFNQIEVEINRLFKTELFNSAEHNLRTNYTKKMTKVEKSVLIGHCVRHNGILKNKTPLINEVFCHRKMDYRVFGVGTIKYPQLTSRLRYMTLAVAGPEEELVMMGITVGILGQPRSLFDNVLRFVSRAKEQTSRSISVGRSLHATHDSTINRNVKIYPNIVLPSKRDSKDDYFPTTFPDESEKVRTCSETQRRRWLNRFMRLLNATP